MSTARITMIAAMDRQGVIGHQGRMPWHIPADLRWFKQQTWGTTLLMGRKTFASIGRALPGRTNLVMTRNPDFTAAQVRVVHDLQSARQQARDSGELMVIGGGQIYAQILPVADRLLITRIDANYAGDTFFPDVDWRYWKTREIERHEANASTPGFRFLVCDRIMGT